MHPRKRPAYKNKILMKIESSDDVASASWRLFDPFCFIKSRERKLEILSELHKLTLLCQKQIFDSFVNDTSRTRADTIHTITSQVAVDVQNTFNAFEIMFFELFFPLAMSVRTLCN